MVKEVIKGKVRLRGKPKMYWVNFRRKIWKWILMTMNYLVSLELA